MGRSWAAAVALCALAAAAAGCGGGSAPAPSATSTKAAFCADNVKLDRATSAITDLNQALPTLKANRSTIDDLSRHYPGGTIGNEARQLVTAVRKAIAANDVSSLNAHNLSQYGADLDTYCGVDSNGAPLPADFGQGRGSALCATDSTLSSGIGSAADPAGAVSFLAAHRSDLDSFAAAIPSLPSDVQTAAQTLLSTARSAVSSNNGALLESQAVAQAALKLSLYCGINQ
ncbi:MAG TPA: hypothetical protein VE990_05895 [Acidimicrobiales bacterium]|nr:hypothetical protein [Acidimicrobiales bacterium]